MPSTSRPRSAPPTPKASTWPSISVYKAAAFFMSPSVPIRSIRTRSPRRVISTALSRFDDPMLMLTARFMGAPDGVVSLDSTSAEGWRQCGRRDPHPLPLPRRSGGGGRTDEEGAGPGPRSLLEPPLKVLRGTVVSQADFARVDASGKGGRASPGSVHCPHSGNALLGPLARRSWATTCLRSHPLLRGPASLVA